MSVATATKTAVPQRVRVKPGTGREVAQRSPAAREKQQDRLSSAARRAYERRKQRAGSLGGEWVELARRGRAGLAARIPFVFTVIGLVACGLAVTLLLTTRAAADSYRLGKAREVNQALAEARTALQREVQAADSAPELAARARGLGMIPAKDPARLVVGADGKVVVVGKPAPAHGDPAPLLNLPAPGGHRTQQLPATGPVSEAGAAAPQGQGERLVPVTVPGGQVPPAVMPVTPPAPVVPAPPAPRVAAPPAPPVVLGGGR